MPWWQTLAIVAGAIAALAGAVYGLIRLRPEVVGSYVKTISDLTRQIEDLRARVEKAEKAAKDCEARERASEAEKADLLRRVSELESIILGSEAHAEGDAEPIGRGVLIVENDRYFRKLLSIYLRRAGVEEVALASSFESARGSIATEPVEFILLDLGLPDVRGVDTVRAVRAVASAAAVIVVTGATDPDLARACIEAGAQDVLNKDELVRDPKKLRQSIELIRARIKTG